VIGHDIALVEGRRPARDGVVRQVIAARPILNGAPQDCQVVIGFAPSLTRTALAIHRTATARQSSASIAEGG
jgi:hypothetical protein